MGRTGNKLRSGSSVSLKRRDEQRAGVAEPDRARGGKDYLAAKMDSPGRDPFERRNFDCRRGNNSPKPKFGPLHWPHGKRMRKLQHAIKLVLICCFGVIPSVAHALATYHPAVSHMSDCPFAAEMLADHTNKSDGMKVQKGDAAQAGCYLKCYHCCNVILPTSVTNHVKPSYAVIEFIAPTSLAFRPPIPPPQV